MKNLFLAFGIAVSVRGAAAFPAVSVQGLGVDAATRRVTVTYAVAEAPAVVTANFRTNGVTLAEGVVKTVSGDVNVVVTNRAACYSFEWNPDRDLPGGLPTPADLSVELQVWSADDPPPYSVIDLTLKGGHFFYASSAAVPGGVQDVRYKTDFLLLRKIPAAARRFRMGSPVGERGAQNAEFGTVLSEVRHWVTLTNDYYMGVYEVTQRQYARITGQRSGAFTDLEVSDLLPVSKVRYSDLRHSDWPSNPNEVGDATWLGKLRLKTGVSTFDLPTDAQWEFACRAGTDTGLNNGTQLDYSNANRWSLEPGVCPALDVVAWWSSNAAWVTNAVTGAVGLTPHPVGQKAPNAWGLFDMLGNVTEFCRDWYSEGDVYSDGTDVVEPVGPAVEQLDSRNRGMGRVVRGGSLGMAAYALRCAYRTRRTATPDSSDVNLYQNGFRVMCLPWFGLSAR